jgi:pyruvate carboxylase
VYEEFKAVVEQYGDLSTLPTRQLLQPLKIGEEFTFDLDMGKTLVVKLVAFGPLHEDTHRRDVYFMINGEARVVSIEEKAAASTGKSSGAGASSRPKANPREKRQIAAPMSGIVVDVRVKAGSQVNLGDPMVVMSAMSNFSLVDDNE